MLDEILDELVSSSRSRRNPRGVKRKMSNFPLRRRTDKPLPPIDIKKAIKVLNAKEPLAKLQWCDEFSTGMSGKRGVRGVLG